MAVAMAVRFAGGLGAQPARNAVGRAGRPLRVEIRCLHPAAGVEAQIEAVPVVVVGQSDHHVDAEPAVEDRVDRGVAMLIGALMVAPVAVRGSPRRWAVSIAFVGDDRRSQLAAKSNERIASRSLWIRSQRGRATTGGRSADCARRLMARLVSSVTFAVMWRKRTGIEPAGTASPHSPSDLKSEPGTSAGNASDEDSTADPETRANRVAPTDLPQTARRADYSGSA
jgi:hypothetical protein